MPDKKGSHELNRLNEALKVLPEPSLVAWQCREDYAAPLQSLIQRAEEGGCPVFDIPRALVRSLALMLITFSPSCRHGAPTG
jgi:hypothetical protein